MIRLSATAGLLVAGIAIVSPSGSAHATGLAGPSERIELADPNSGGSDFFFNTLSGAEYGASASINLASGPTVMASGTSQGSDYIASAALTYYFSYTAPAEVTSALIDLTYSYDFLGVASGPANPGGNVTGGFIRVAGSYAFDSSSTFGELSGTNAVYQLSLAPGASSAITLSVTAYGAGSYAFLDPTLSIDPTYLANNGYTASQFAFTQSAGVANGVVTTVSEPDALALMGSSLVTLVLLRIVARSSNRTASCRA